MLLLLFLFRHIHVIFIVKILHIIIEEITFGTLGGIKHAVGNVDWIDAEVLMTRYLRARHPYKAVTAILKCHYPTLFLKVHATIAPPSVFTLVILLT